MDTRVMAADHAAMCDSFDSHVRQREQLDAALSRFRCEVDTVEQLAQKYVDLHHLGLQSCPSNRIAQSRCNVEIELLKCQVAKLEELKHEKSLTLLNLDQDVLQMVESGNSDFSMRYLLNKSDHHPLSDRSAEDRQLASCRDAFNADR